MAMGVILFKLLSLISLIVFKYWFEFEFWCFNSAVHTKLLKILVNGCRNFRKMLLLYKELWWNIGWYFIGHFSSFWEAHCFWVYRNQLFSNQFLFLILLFHEIHPFFFCSFKNLIRFIKLGLEFGLEAIFVRWIFRSESKHFVFNVLWWELVWFLFFLELYQLFFWLLRNFIRWRKLGLGFSLKVIFRRWIFRGESKHFIFSVFWW